MKIAGCVFRQSEIQINNENTFAARYRKRTIYVSSEHGFGKAKEPGKTRFYQEVYGDDGIYDMECYNDFHNIEESIKDTLEGAGLAKNN